MSKVQPKPLKQTGVVSRANKLYLSEKQVLHHMLFGQDLPGERLTLQTLVRQISAVQAVPPCSNQCFLSFGGEANLQNKICH